MSEIVTLQEIGETFYSLGPSVCPALKTPEALALLTHRPRRDAVIVARLYG
jgi:hypothetical protein